MMKPALTCKFCRFIISSENGALEEHGPVDNRCEGSLKPVVGALDEKSRKQYLAYRKKLEALVWRTKHPDFRGKREDGTKCILKFVSGVGTSSVEVSSLTEAECIDAVPSKVRDAEGL